jgi:hypothetical protein
MTGDAVEPRAGIFVIAMRRVLPDHAARTERKYEEKNRTSPVHGPKLTHGTRRRQAAFTLASLLFLIRVWD